MVFKFIRRRLTRAINQGEDERGQFTGENTDCTIITNAKVSAKNYH